MAHSQNKNLSSLQAEGDFQTGNNGFDMNIYTDRLRLKIFQPFLQNISSDLDGLVTANLEISGTATEPVVNGDLVFKETGIKIDYLNSKFSFSDTVFITNNQSRFNNIEIQDSLGNKAHAKGYISFNDFRNPDINLQMDVENLLMLNIQEWQNDLFYGTAYGSGVISITGKPKNLNIDIAVQTADNTDFYLTLYKGNPGRDLSFIKFATEYEETSDPPWVLKPASRVIQKGNLGLHINIEATPEAETTLFLDPTAGGSMRVRGSGNINITINPANKFSISGEYIIDQGTYNFVLSHVINKRFEVKGGSRISWNGNPAEATLDVTAAYKLRTSLYNLFYDEAYQRRIPVECEIHLTGQLESPEIKFNITLPTSDEETKTRLQNTINTEEDLTKQFLSLLIINSFLPDPNYAPAGSTPLLTNSVEVTTAEVLSNQLSNWVSQISNDFDIGFHYRPGDEVSRQEIEVALTTQILNDRVLINSNIGTRGGANGTTDTSNDIVGDVAVEVKIDKRGKFRVKAFTRPNDKMIYENAPYTSGIGIFFREEFNSFGALVKNYWNKIFRGKNKEDL